jgi:hypothetical protein
MEQQIAEELRPGRRAEGGAFRGPGGIRQRDVEVGVGLGPEARDVAKTDRIEQRVRRDINVVIPVRERVLEVRQVDDNDNESDERGRHKHGRAGGVETGVRALGAGGASAWPIFFLSIAGHCVRLPPPFFPARRQ